MHKLLQRQLRRFVSEDGVIPEDWHAFVEAVEAAYRQADEDRGLLERSLELTSRELLERNRSLRTRLKEGETTQKQLQAYARQQRAIAELGEIAFAGATFEELTERAARTVAQTLDLSHTALLELVASDRQVRLCACHGWPAEQIGRLVLPAVEGTQTAFALESGLPLLVRDLAAEARFNPDPVLLDVGVASLISVVVEAASGTWGLLSACSTVPRPFTPDDVKFLQSVANILSQTLVRDQVQEARQLSENKYRTLFERANVPILLFRAEDDVVLEANDEACRTYGYDRDELIGASLQLLTADPNRNEDEIERILRRGNSQNFETVHFRKDGKPIDLLVSCSVVQYDGAPAVLCFERDITDRKRAELLLHESETRMRAITRHTIDIIAIIDATMQVRHIFGPVLELVGHDPLLLRGKEAMHFVHPDDRMRVRSAFIRSLRMPSDIIEVEFRFLHGDGGWRHLSARGKNYLEEPGVDGILINIRDVTDRILFEQRLVKARDKAEEMARLKSAFLANMSHEIRTPLTAILGFAEILSEEIDDDRREFAEMIRQGGLRLSETLNSVLDLARLEAGQFDARLEPTCIAAAVRETVGLFMSMAAKHDLSLSADLESEHLVALLDSAAFNRVLSNLLSNAIKFTDQGGVVVRAYTADDRVCVTVEDTGVGIGPEFIPHLFEEFKQESTGLTRKHEGTGLGLTITKRLVELMRGQIEVESRIGEGTVFTLSFTALNTPQVGTSGNVEDLMGL